MVKKRKADQIRVEICVLGGEVKTVLLNGGATVQDGLNSAGVTGDRVKCEGEELNLTDIVEDGDQLIVTSAVKGGK